MTSVGFAYRAPLADLRALFDISSTCFASRHSCSGSQISFDLFVAATEQLLLKVSNAANARETCDGKVQHSEDFIQIFVRFERLGNATVDKLAKAAMSKEMLAAGSPRRPLRSAPAPRRARRSRTREWKRPTPPSKAAKSVMSSATRLGSLIAEAVADAAQKVMSGKWPGEESYAVEDREHALAGEAESEALDRKKAGGSEDDRGEEAGCQGKAQPSQRPRRRAGPPPARPTAAAARSGPAEHERKARRPVRRTAGGRGSRRARSLR